MAYISTNKLAQELNIDRNELIEKLQQLNLLDKNKRLTKNGIKKGGEYKKYMGTEYISWKDRDTIISLLETKKSIFEKVIDSVKGTQKSNNVSVEKSIDPRKNYKTPEYRTEDGHYVRSKAELIIDNWLYNKNIVHAYEKKLPTKENLLSDFYLPMGKVYIEFWGYENQKEYLKRKKIKQKIYEKYAFNLIELNDKEVQNLDDILPKMLLDFGIKAY